MTIITYTPQTLYAPKKAEELAKEMQAQDPEWTYQAEHDPTGKGLSSIVVYDEDRRKMGYV